MSGTSYCDTSTFWAHASEMERTGEKWLSFFKNEAENAGQRIGVKYAEVYEVVKWLEN